VAKLKEKPSNGGSEQEIGDSKRDSSSSEQVPTLRELNGSDTSVVSELRNSPRTMTESQEDSRQAVTETAPNPEAVAALLSGELSNTIAPVFAGPSSSGQASPGQRLETDTIAGIGAHTDAGSVPPRRGRPVGSKTRGKGANPFPERGTAAAGTPESSRRFAELERENAALREQVTGEVAKQLAEFLTQGISMGGDILAAYRGVHWRIPQEEAAKLGVPLATALLPYMSYFASAMPWIAVAGGAAAIALPRLQVEAKIESGEAVRVMPSAATGEVYAAGE
jgi:hypothetical protein